MGRRAFQDAVACDAGTFGTESAAGRAWDASGGDESRAWALLRLEQRSRREGLMHIAAAVLPLVPVAAVVWWLLCSR